MPIDSPTPIDRIAQEIAQIRKVTWDALPSLADLPDVPVAWLAEGIVAEGEITFLTGEPGNFKSWLSLILARSIATGRPFLHRQCKKILVLYLDRDNPDSVVGERKQVLGLGDIPNLKYWGGWCKEAVPMLGDFRYLELAKDFKPLFIFDSMIRFHGAKENDSSEMNPVMRQFRDLADAGGTVVLQHHVGRGEGSNYRGSSDIVAGVDAAFKVSFDDQSKTVTFKTFKSRHAKDFTMTLRPDFGEHGEGDDFVVTQAPEYVSAKQQSVNLQELIAGNPGMHQTEVIQKSGLPKKKAAELLNSGNGELWKIERGIKNARLYFPLGQVTSLLV